MTSPDLVIGAVPDGTGTTFRVWAPDAKQVEVLLYDGETATPHPLAAENNGYFSAHLPGISAGQRYMYRLNGGDPRPDPASRSQPESVHGPSAVVDPRTYTWHDGDWRGMPLSDMVIYEIHVGTATPEGTFEALIAHLDSIRDLGITAIELMPVADFPGDRNWGYDGVNIFAPARTYGGAEGLRALVDAAHARGLAVLLDVVYNHFGPDGNYLSQFSPFYFTERHHTPWGAAINVDGPNSRPVRDYFIANAVEWARDYHFDGLRLDATHAIIDDSPVHVLAEMAASVRKTLSPGRHFVMIAENEHNDTSIVQEAGMALDGVWADDFHHQVRVALAGDRDGYYADYTGTADDLAATLRQGWFYTGQVSQVSGKPRGTPSEAADPAKFIYCIQNHDQIGNRAVGDRLNGGVPLAGYRAASALLLLSPYTPLLFMGQEWAASTPFLFFTHHNDELGKLITAGRRREFAGFSAFAGQEVPDPQSEDTFLRSKLAWEERETPPHNGVLRLYRDLLALRHDHPALLARSRESFAVAALAPNTLGLRRNGPNGEALLLVVNLRESQQIDLDTSPLGAGEWHILLDTETERYGGDTPATLDGATLHIAGPGAVLLSL